MIGEQLVADALPFVRVAAVVLFGSLAVVAIVQAPRTGRAGMWVAAAFSCLSLALLGSLISATMGPEEPEWLADAWILAVAAVPYLLLRFSATFRAVPRLLEVVAATAAAGVLVATLVLPPLPGGDEPWPAWAEAYLAGVLSYWVLLSLVTITHLWTAGHGQPTVARRRMRLMSVATALATTALLLAGANRGTSALAGLVVHVLAVASAMVFGVGFSPPRAVRLAWRQAEDEHLQRGTVAVLRASSAEEIAEELLPPTVSIVGAGGAAIVDADGFVVAAHGQTPSVGMKLAEAGEAGPDRSASTVVPLGDGRGELVVWTSPYTPFFGREEDGLLQTMGAIAALALERCELLAEERSQRAAVEQAQREAERAREEATRANTAKTEFLSRMSHELRTPLNAILGFGQLLETSPLDGEDREGVLHILKAGRHLLELINEVLDLSRIEAGTLTISLEPVDAGELLHDAVALIQPLAESRSISLEVDDSACDVYVRTDRQRCRQVLLNLLSNAVKYNHDGGRVDVWCAHLSDGTLQVFVRDSGRGIDPARQARLFQPFERLGAESSTVEGTGLGLALSKQLMERLEGAIGVETAPGRGSTFWIELPVTDPPDEEDDQARPDEVSTAEGARTLLLVEDNLANLRLVEAMLRRRPGISVLPAMQGGLAVELACEHRPDVIVLDLHLPDVPGREILHRLQADPRTRDVPVVVASADATPSRIRQLREEGAFEYVPKPLDLGHFLATVDAALAHRDGNRGVGTPGGGG